MYRDDAIMSLVPTYQQLWRILVPTYQQLWRIEVEKLSSQDGISSTTKSRAVVHSRHESRECRLCHRNNFLFQYKTGFPMAAVLVRIQPLSPKPVSRDPINLVFCVDNRTT